MKIVTVAEMRALERQAEAEGITTAQLMEQAGQAVAKEARGILQGAAGRSVIVLVGPGNNGGDGLVAARCLVDWGAHVRVCLLAPRSQDDSHVTDLLLRGVPILDVGSRAFLASLSQSLEHADIVLDAILGTGRGRPLEGVYKEVAEAVLSTKATSPRLQVVALDLPTGLDADTGATDPACIAADWTVTLAFPKPGLFAFPGAAAVGHLLVADIGIPVKLAEDLPVELMTDALVAPLLPKRPLQANKGSFGRILVVAGSGNYIGASMLACRSALRAGAGLVTLAAPRSLVNMVAGSLVEATYAPLPETNSGAIAQRALHELEPLLSRYDVLLLGCGLGQHPETQAFVTGLLSSETPLPDRLVLDADGLNVLAQVPSWWTRLRAQTVLTPHAGEMARLAGTSVAEVQQDRIATARKAAQEWRQVVVLKGAHTAVAAPQNEARVSPFANPVLASAGTGDVLAGVIAGLMGQGVAPYDAATVGVYLHGLAGQLFSSANGDTGLLASDLVALLPQAIQRVKHQRQ